jgi:hypothetical protein
MHMNTLTINVKDVLPGDLLLTTLASDHRVIFGSVITDTSEYDEQQYFRCTEGGTYQFNLSEIVTVVRSDYNTDPEGEW